MDADEQETVAAGTNSLAPFTRKCASCNCFVPVADIVACRSCSAPPVPQEDAVAVLMDLREAWAGNVQTTADAERLSCVDLAPYVRRLALSRTPVLEITIRSPAEAAALRRYVALTAELDAAPFNSMTWRMIFTDQSTAENDLLKIIVGSQPKAEPVERGDESQRFWGYSLDPMDEDGWHGMRTTKEEAIAAARAGNNGVDFWVCSGMRPKPESFLSSARMLFEAANERADDVATFEGHPTIFASETALDALDDLLDTWARRNIVVNFWEPDGEPELVRALPLAEACRGGCGPFIWNDRENYPQCKACGHEGLLEDWDAQSAEAMPSEPCHVVQRDTASSLRKRIAELETQLAASHDRELK